MIVIDIVASLVIQKIIILKADEFGYFCSIEVYDGDEEEILTRFLDYIDTNNPKIISYNARAEYLPFVMIRAMKYNLTCSAYFEKNNMMLNKNKWENYQSRFSDNFHIDIKQAFSEFGIYNKIELDKLIKLYNMIEQDKDTVEINVINIYWLFLKYELLRGHIILSDYQSILEQLNSIYTFKEIELELKNIVA